MSVRRRRRSSVEILSNDDARDLIAVQRTLRGEDHAFDDIVERFTPILFSLALRLLGNREEAEDAVQEILIRAYRSLKSFNIEARFFTWLYTIAINLLRSMLRKRSRRYLELPLPERHDESAVPAGESSDPVTPLLEQEAYRDARRAVESLKPIYRVVFVMHYYELLPLKQIAEILHLPLGTIKVRIHRARKILAAQLSSDGSG